MPHRFCHFAAGKHGECVLCLGAAHAETTLTGRECHHCGDMGLSSLHSRHPAPRTLPIFSSQRPAMKKQWGRGFQHAEMSELSPAVNSRTSLSPHREISPVLFTRPDQHPSASASDLVSFGGSDDSQLDDSLSLAASDADELVGSYNDPAHSQSAQPSASSPGMDADLFRVLSNSVEELGLEWSPPVAAWINASCRGTVRPLVNELHHSFEVWLLQPLLPRPQEGWWSKAHSSSQILS